VVFCSLRAWGVAHALGAGRAPYRIVGALATTPDSQALPVLERFGVPWILHDPRAFHRSRGAPLADPAVRREFDRASLDLISRFAPDALALVGYLYVVTAPLLEAFPGRLVNLHDADLLLTGEDGRPRFPGLHAVRDAILAGERETRSTAHLVTQEVDGGPAVVRSWAFPVHGELVRAARRWGREDVLRAYAYAHREWMIGASWGALLEAALRLVAEGRVAVSGGAARVDGRPGPLTLAADGTSGPGPAVAEAAG
jgi:folate-dependent phosphoribosylglycinamide formyltransferase PurN